MSNFYQHLSNLFTKPIIGIILLCCLFSTNGYAQPFPVSVNTQLTTPSLPYLADYVRDKPESIRTILLLNDDSRLNYEVLLKIKISGQGIELASRADYFSAPINLMYNVPEILTGFELADLFDPNNLEITGMSKSEFLKTGLLPEGIYTICFEAYDINRFDELPVSNGGCAVASVIEHEPPYLIQPMGLAPFTQPTILPFNWHPGHTNNFLTEYRLYLYEDIPGWTEDQIILYQAPLYTTEVNTTTYLYSAIDPFLNRGASYYWRVQALDPAGFELFKNNGFSQLAKFTYGQDCDTPLGLQALTVSESSQLIRWVDSRPGTYELRMRGEAIAINTNQNNDPTPPANNIPSGIDNKNGKGKNNLNQLGGNNSPVASPVQTPTNTNAPPSYLPTWRTISDINEQEYLLTDLGSIRYEIQVRRVCGSGNVSPFSVTLELDNRQPDAPEFLLPPQTTEPTEITEELFTANWNYQTEAYFELQVARDTGFAIPLPGYESLTVTDLQQPITGLISGQTYYYRVKAKRGDLESVWSNVQTVQTESNDPYNIPTILALPAQSVNYEGFIANWTGTTMMMLYHLEVARDREFTQPLPGYEDGVLQITNGMLELPIPIDLVSQGAFYRIRTAGIGGLGYSNIIEIPRQYLPIPIALEPTDVNATGFTANWEALSQASEYIIDVSTSPDFSEVIPELSNQTVSGTSISFNQFLDPENTTYFYQVRAKIEGRTSGNSNPVVVSDGRLAVVPITEPATQIKKTSFWANWQNLPGINTYALDVATSPDFSEGSFLAGYENKIVYGESHKVDPVNFASTQYFYRVRAVVDEVYSIYSNDQNVSWKGCYFGPMAMDYSCGIPADPYFDEGLPMIAELEKGDTIQAGDFLVILNEVTGSSPFSGKGYVAMPFQQVRLNLEFTNIKVDETCRMVDGRMEVTGAGLALISEEIADKINEILEVLDQVDDVLASIEDVLADVSDVLNASESVGGYFTNGINLLDGVDPILDEYPYLPPSSVDSLRLALECFRNTANPKQCKEDLVQSLQILQNSLVDHFNSSQQIIFQASPDQVYGFDSIVHPAFAEHYQGITVAGKPYQIAWKSVENGQTDIVEARTENGLPFPANIRFEDTAQNEIPTEIVDNIARLTITGVGDQVAYPIYAVETGDTVKLAGKLNIVSYDLKPINLVVVPVNGAVYPFSKEVLNSKLKDLFKGPILDLSVTVVDNFQVNEFDGELDAIATGFARSYTDEMKTIFQGYENNHPVDENTYYIFLLPRFANSNQLGYMPRKKQFGFVNNEPLQQAEDRYVKTIAHELAHGAFVLHHTFEQHPQLAENPTENLLDYSTTGTITHQYQWAAMHDPSRAWTLFDEDEESGQVTIYNEDIWIKNLNEIACKKFDYDDSCPIEVLCPIIENSKTGNVTRYPVSFTYREIPVKITSSGIKKLPISGTHTLDISDFNVETGPEYSVISYAFLENDKFLEFTIPTPLADRFIEFFEVDLQDYQYGLVASLPTEKSDEAIRELRRLPYCVLKQIPIEKRILYLNWVRDDFFVNKDQELIFLNLIKYNNYQEELYEALYRDQGLIWHLYKSIDFYRSEYLNEIYFLCNTNWSVDQPVVANIPVGIVPADWGTYQSRSFILLPYSHKNLFDIPKGVTKVNYDITIGLYPKGLADWGNVQPFAYVDSMSVNFLDPVKVVSSDKNDQDLFKTPFLWIADKQAKAESKAFIEQLMVTLEVFAFVDAFKVISTGTKIAKTLAAADLIKGGVDKIVMDKWVMNELKKSKEGRRFLEIYQIISVAYDFGSMGIGMVDEVIQLSKKTNQSLMTAQKIDAAEIVEGFTKEMRIMKMLPKDLATRLGTDNFQKLQAWISKHWDLFGDEVKVQELLNRLELIPGSDNPNKYISFLDVYDEADDIFRGWILGGEGTERLDLWKNCYKNPAKAKDTPWLKNLLASSGTSKIDNVNPLDIYWFNNIKGHNSPTNAVAFWNDVSKDYLYYTKGSYIFKYDFDSGTLFFANSSTKKVIGFSEGGANIANFVYQSRPDQLMGKLKRYHGLNGPSALILNLPFNFQVSSTPGKTTTILGRSKFQRFASGDMRTVINELVNNFTSIYIGPNIGGFNVLNVSKELYEGSSFWESFNLPWLLAAIDREDVIVAASDPMDLKNIFRNFKDIPITDLTTPESIATFLKDLDKVGDSDIINNMTYYGKEIKLLSENDYLFDPQLKKFIK